MMVLSRLAAASLVLALAASAVAQGSYPERTIRILVGFPPGGPPDIAARLLAEKFSAGWGKSVVVENATGGGGNIAVERAVKAPPDGYTLLMASNAIARASTRRCRTMRCGTSSRSRLRSRCRSSLLSTTRCRRRRCRNSRRWRDRNRDSSPSATQVLARPRISRENCSSRLPASMSNRCPIAACRCCCRICSPGASPWRFPISRSWSS